jgi:exonuclease III
MSGNPWAIRHLHGDSREYTWYSHRNNGFRLDYAFCSPHLAAAVAYVQHAWGYDHSQPERRDALSDHAALIIDLECHKIQEAKPVATQPEPLPPM